MARIAAEMKANGSVVGIPIGHAGLKASANLPLEADDHIPAGDPRGWEMISPSPTAFGGDLARMPREMTIFDIERVKGHFVSPAKRALADGFQWSGLHFGHCYLAQSFSSGHANERTSAYSGDWRKRWRFLVGKLEAARQVWPEHLPLTARFGVIKFNGRDEETMAGLILPVKECKVGTRHAQCEHRPLDHSRAETVV